MLSFRIFLRRLPRDGLDIHAAGLRAHHHDAARRAVEHEGKVIFLLDIRARLDEQAMNLLALRPRLLRDERRAQELLRELLDLGEGPCELHASCLAASACVDLRLHDLHGAGQLLRSRHRLIDAECRIPLRHLHAEFLQDGLALIFMYVHSMSLTFVLLRNIIACITKMCQLKSISRRVLFP
jgi:hypothetical protein